MIHSPEPCVDHIVKAIQNLTTNKDTKQNLQDTFTKQLATGEIHFQQHPDGFSMVQEVAQAECVVMKRGHPYQLREVLQFRNDGVITCVKDIANRLQTQRITNPDEWGLSTSKPFQFVGGKKTTTDASFSARLTIECQEELSSALDTAIEHNGTWKRIEKQRDHQEFGVPVIYRLGRTTLPMNWTDFKESHTLTNIALSADVRSMFDTTQKIQGRAGTFDWAKTQEGENEMTFDFVVSQDGTDGKWLVFMLVREEWLGEADVSETVVEEGLDDL